MIEDKNEIRMVKKAIRGNVNAYGELIELHKEYLYRTAYLYSKNEDTALDIVQDCILKGFQNIRKLRDAAYFKTWITRILINAANDTYKKASKVIPIEEVEHQPSDKKASIEEKWDLYEAIDVLPGKYRTVIILKYFEEMKLGEIAYTMNIPEGSVSAYLTRAKQELRKYLKEDYMYG